LLATIAELDTDQQRLEQAILEGLPDYLTHVLDILGTTLVQAILASHGGKYRHKHIFKTQKKKKPSEFILIDGKLEEVVFG